MNSTPHFWIFYRKTLKYLLESEKVYESDKILLASNGALERYQFKILLENKKDILSKVISDENNKISFHSFFFGFNFIQSDEVIQLQTSLELFREYKGDKNLVYLILLGVTNHWSLLVIENKKGIFKFNYLDSNNILKIFDLKKSDEVSEYLTYTCSNVNDFDKLRSKDKQIEKFADEYINDISKYRKPPPGSPLGWFRTCFIQWLSDINISIKLLFKVIYENYSLYDNIIECTLSRIVHTFAEYNQCEYSKSWIDNLEISDQNERDASNFFDKLVSWLNNEYHPSTLEKELINSLKKYDNARSIKKMQLYDNFVLMICYIEKIEKFVKKIEDEAKTNLIDRFYGVICRIKDLISK
jgi:hypothetical protein